MVLLVSGFALYSCGDGKQSPEYKSAPFEAMRKSVSLEGIELSSLVSPSDTVCGMRLDKGVADTLHEGSLIYGFCSTGCKVKFQKILDQR